MCLMFFAPGLVGLPPLDRDEARYAQASRQMAQSGDYLRIHFQDKTRYKKPAGIYWLQSLAVKLSGRPGEIWPYRLPSLLGGLASVLLLFYWGRRLAGAAVAFWAASLLAASLLLVFVAHQATTDAALLAALVTAQGALGAAYLAGRTGQPVSVVTAVAFWAAQGAAILLKGPVGPFISLATIAGLWAADGNLAWFGGLRPKRGAALALLIAGPWFVAVSLASGGAFWQEALGKDFLPKLVAGQESHGAPPLYYLALTFVSFWPGCLLLAPALVLAWRHRAEALPRFLLAWLVPAWVVLEAVPTKLPHYVLPLFPALALLAAHAALARGPALARALARPRAWFGVALWGFAPLVLAAGALALPLVLDQSFHWLSLAPLAGAACLLGLAPLKSWRQNPLRLLAASLAAAVLLYVPLFQEILPNLKGLWLSKRAEEMVSAHKGPGVGPGLAVPAVGYHEPSLVFHLGEKTPLVSARHGARLLASGEYGLALVSGDKLKRFTLAMQKEGYGARPLAKARAQHYTKGKWVTLHLVEPYPLFLQEGRLRERDAKAGDKEREAES